MGIYSWPAIEKHYKIPKRFNVAIDATGLFYMSTAEIVLQNLWIYNLITKAEEVALLYDGRVPIQKQSERFRRKRNRAVFSEYFNTAHYDTDAHLISQFTKRPLLIEQERSFGEGEMKMLSCNDWIFRDLPILCIVNDNDFYQLLIHVPPCNFPEIKTKPNIEKKEIIIPQGKPNYRFFQRNNLARNLLYYKVDKYGVVDFWKDYTSTQRMNLLIWTTIAWGNDYVVGIAPSLKWKSLEILDTPIDTFDDLVDSIMAFFRFLKKQWPKKITSICGLDTGNINPSLGTKEEVDELINMYLEQIIWSILYMTIQPTDPGEFELKFKDGLIIYWKEFSHSIQKITPLSNIIDHCLERERYKKLKCIIFENTD